MRLDIFQMVTPQVNSIEISLEKGEERQFKIVDTGENGENINILDEWICNTNGFILVFAQ